MQQYSLIKLRKKWFVLKTKEFINRYFMGIIVLIMFLPGVGVSENFAMLMLVISKPYAVIVQLDSSFINKLVWLSLLIIIFVVWSRAQRLAIAGGEFATFLHSWPINKTSRKIINAIMLLIGNHLLWPIILASYFNLSIGDNNTVLALARNTFLILLLLVIQYLSIFQNTAKKTFFIFVLSLVFTLPLNPSIESVRMALVYFLLFLFVYFQLFKEKNYSSRHFYASYLLPAFLSRNFYWQIVFKSGLTSSLFRLTIIISLIIGFTFAIDNWVTVYNELTPYYLALEAFLAYFISGFYVMFLDQRNTMQSWLVTLPIKHHFWLVRDILMVLILTVIVHIPFYYWASNLSDVPTLAFAFAYHSFLLILCYPMRIFVVEKQTLVTFVVLFIITAITLFNLP